MTDQLAAALHEVFGAGLCVGDHHWTQPCDLPEQWQAWARDVRAALAQAEPAGLDVERLVKAIREHYATGRHGWSHQSCATAIAMDYAVRLARQGDEG